MWFASPISPEHAATVVTTTSIAAATTSQRTAQVWTRFAFIVAVMAGKGSATCLNVTIASERSAVLSQSNATATRAIFNEPIVTAYERIIRYPLISQTRVGAFDVVSFRTLASLHLGPRRGPRRLAGAARDQASRYAHREAAISFCSGEMEQSSAKKVSLSPKTWKKA